MTESPETIQSAEDQGKQTNPDPAYSGPSQAVTEEIASEPKTTKASSSKDTKGKSKAKGSKEKQLSYAAFREAFGPVPNPFLPGSDAPTDKSHPKRERCVFNSIGEQAVYARDRAGDGFSHLWSLVRQTDGKQQLLPGLPPGVARQGLVLTEVPWGSPDQVVDL